MLKSPCFEFENGNEATKRVSFSGQMEMNVGISIFYYSVYYRVLYVNQAICLNPVKTIDLCTAENVIEPNFQSTFFALNTTVYV